MRFPTLFLPLIILFVELNIDIHSGEMNDFGAGFLFYQFQPLY